MLKFFFSFGLILAMQSGVLAQCLSNLNCPTASQIICDTTLNDTHYWSDSIFNDPAINSHDLGETPTNISMQIVDTCGAGDVQVSFVLLLDLNGDGVRETVISSDSLPAAGIIYYGNAANPNYTGGEAKAFDTRNVPSDQKYGFTLERVVQDSLITVKIRWANTLAPNDYVLPELPYGAHRVEWRFEKNGEVKTCGYDFVVKDCQPPTVTCINGLTLPIMPTNPPVVQLWTVDLISSNSSPYDNYTPSDRLQFGIRRSGIGTGFPVDTNGESITNILFGCEVGTHPVELWVRDLAGNASYCETYIILQSEFGCDGSIEPPIYEACAVNHCDAAAISEVNFALIGTSPGLPPYTLLTISSSDSGCVTFNNAIPINSTVSIVPSKDDNPLNGVTTYDLVLISKHILAIEPLGSPYKIIAADANRSGAVTAADLVELRKLIIGIYQDLPDNTSWRFVDKAFVFPNTANPFQTVFPENKTIASTQQNSGDADFVGVKIGDVNCTALANFTTIPSEEALIIPDFHLQANEVVEVPIHFSQADDYQGFQFGLHFDPTKVEILNVIPEIGTRDNFGLFLDHLNVSWSDVNSSVFLPDEALFRIRIKALAPLQLANVFSLTTEKLHAEAYSENDNPVNLRLQFAVNATTETNIAQQIFEPMPNPTNAGVRIPLRLEESETVVVEILDVTGRVVYQKKQMINTGTQLIELPAAAFPQAGIYTWRVQAGTTSKTGKIVKQ